LSDHSREPTRRGHLRAGFASASLLFALGKIEVINLRLVC